MQVGFSYFRRTRTVGSHFRLRLAKGYNESMELPSEHAGAQQGRVISYRDP